MQKLFDFVDGLTELEAKRLLKVVVLDAQHLADHTRDNKTGNTDEDWVVYLENIKNDP